MQSFDFVNRANADYIDQLYQRFRADPRTVDEQWRAFFTGVEAAGGRLNQKITPEQLVCPNECCPLTSGIYDLVHSYRELGHFVAKLDPLGHNRTSHPLLELPEFGLSLADLERTVGAGSFLGKPDGSLRDLIEKSRATYCGTLGVEYMTVPDKEQRQWLQERMEPALNRPAIGPDEAREILQQLVAAQEFEEFLQTKYLGQKRFSIEGAEALVPLLNTIVEDGAKLGAEEMVIGTAHRGRLNVLAHVMRKPFEIVFSEFEGSAVPHDAEGDGDVKYHLGYSHDLVTRGGHKMHLSLPPNPSHLELIDPVVEGNVLAKQEQRGDVEHRRIVPILMHGDAAFTGQGIVHETLELSELPHYRTGGTIHIIINNQIGFTTLPAEGRFTPYPTDVAKMIQAPIFHVNGDDPEMVVHAAKLAIAFRQRFGTDVFIDLWCYRRWGHNEVDEPAFTQPLMYQEIAQHPTVRDIYTRKLVDEGKITLADVEKLKAAARQRLDRALVIARETRPKHPVQSLQGVWTGITRAGDDWNAQTAVPAETLARIGEAATRVPADFSVHPKLKRFLAARLEMARGRQGIDWGCAEMLALGSLLLEGTPIRFVGQDTERGTFSHRHATLHDYRTGKEYVPLAHLADRQARFLILNTMLSELAVLGFEYGYSTADPRILVIWEAQFGDFVNGAQPVIDQFIAAGESKWQRMSGMVMLLPHGYEGQGPEHSNAYIERFLSLGAENNIQVCLPSLPAQYFHLLRRQMHRPFRKPLIIFTPKSMLRSESSASKLEELTAGGFQTVIDDPAILHRDRVRRLVFCSGKIYFHLQAAREARPTDELALVRIEQMYPLPQREIQAVLARYRSVRQVAWVQEEPRNRGGWLFMEDRLSPLLPRDVPLRYIGRDEAASPATGSFRLHQIEEEEIVAHALATSAAETRVSREPRDPAAALAR